MRLVSLASAVLLVNAGMVVLGASPLAIGSTVDRVVKPVPEMTEVSKVRALTPNQALLDQQCLLRAAPTQATDADTYRLRRRPPELRLHRGRATLGRT
jgi:hypothetical protein